MPEFQIIDNNDTQVDYQGSWQPNPVFSNGDNSTIVGISHSTAEISSSVFVPFNGSQIRVFGIVPPGQGALVANYYVDSSSPSATNSEPILTQNTSMPDQLLFESSSILGAGEHNLTIEVIQTGSDRNYTLSYFQVQPSTAVQTATPSNTTQIVLGVLGGVLLLLAVVFGTRRAMQWRKKRLQMIQHDFEKQPAQTMNSSNLPSWRTSDSTAVHNQSQQYTAEGYAGRSHHTKL
ncbi:uncharacterized protein FOMMEDRAFT_160833 [Fomitiporia mediterranea MF3/22]|uniref:uncharacterized protein n=1 Tax=Fomitiporia mediterranea (strain MF3/22) TaxID=694068 RepID=UPI00044090A4|nr:uncharacterized protein FOMMEDRAFT_160833 [Fomitiporia mediterranea MF3/22]EJC99240.1 hypothetical protein FOMMEDRAFT_160833 [Fomitiporia mediterranea MF3/22]